MKIQDIARDACVDPAGVVRVLQRIRQADLPMLVAVLKASPHPVGDFDLADHAVAAADVPRTSRPIASLSIADLIGDFRVMVDAILATVHEPFESPAGKPDPAGTSTGNDH